MFYRNTYKKQRLDTTLAFYDIAEAEGFEPPVPRGTTVFKTAAFDHSATPLCLCNIFGVIVLLAYYVQGGPAAFDGDAQFTLPRL